ncbi:insulinase family protein [Duganella sp. BJB1802]|nr:insulinase family protein [Duganella sp. BJB1802]
MFIHTSSHPVAALQATIDQYVHPESGARHIHIGTDAAEMAFLVAFPTVPDASDGRAHILEHMALSGSERFPVRAPFFAMLRRSTATFMNAMTYADRTAYPFATTDRQDFFNLLDVYLDASFFPKLDYLDFLQEGWRHVFEGDKLAYQGVVLNEMKGAIADPMHALHQGIVAPLFRGTTYEVESGGDPLAIPDLSHDMLREFHASHYHPSQALFMSAGPIAAVDIQQRIASAVLTRRPGAAGRRQPALAPAWTGPREQQLRIPSQRGRADEHGMQIAWLIGEMADPTAYYDAQLLWFGLLGDAAAPLRAALESAGFGRPSRMMGPDTNMRQMVFHVGMEGLTEAQLGAAYGLIWSTLERVAADGVSLGALRSALRIMRYQQRNTESGATPFALRRMLQALPLALYGGDIVGAFDNEPALAALEERIQDPGFFKGLVRSLLDNPTRLTTTVVPDAQYFVARSAAEQARLAARQAALSDADRDRIVRDNAALAAYQAVPTDKTALPRIRPADVSPTAPPLPAVAPPRQGAACFDVAGNGISYARVRYDVSGLGMEDWQWLRLYADLLPELGGGARGYAAAGAWRQALVPAFGVDLDATQRPDGSLALGMCFFASALREEHAAIADVLSASISGARFDETARLAFLIERLVQNKLNGLANAGSEYAMLAASAPLSALRHFQNVLDGAPALAFYGALKVLVRTEQGLAQVAARLAALHAAITASAPTRLCAGAGADAIDLAGLLAAGGAGAQGGIGSVSVPGTPAANLALHAVGQVNHCVMAWRVPGTGHPDGAALAVAAELIGANLLHQSLREKGGAYGGYARYGSEVGVFSLSSYRDPRLADTYADFAAALEAVVHLPFDEEQLEEAIISVIKASDKPLSPYASALHAWRLQQRGIDTALRQQFRSGVLGCTLSDIRRAVQTWLPPGTASRAAFVGNAAQDLAGLDLVDLMGLAQQP